MMPMTIRGATRFYEEYLKMKMNIFRYITGLKKANIYWTILFFVILGTFIGAAVSLFVMKQRAQWLAALEFELTPPPVPFAVLQDIQTAERNSYAKRPPLRRAVEEAQDVLVFASPGLAYRLNFSVG